MKQKIPETANIIPSDFVIIGGTGHLSVRKILPALFWRFLDKQIDKNSQIILCDRNIKSPSEFFDNLKQHCSEAIKKDKNNKIIWEQFFSIIKIIELDVVSGEGHLELLEILKANFDEKRPIIFYLAIASSLFGNSCKFIRDSGLNVPQSRLVIEKPIGKNKETAIEINNEISSIFKESQIYRIDHYLGKETVQNLMALRFANTFFENQWNNNNIDHVQITVSETIGVKERIAYYNEYGAIRDMLQNHLLQLICLIAMEPPSFYEADQMRDEKLRVLKALKPIAENEIQTGQYRSFSDELEEISNTETYVALKVMINNWRWAGVPFYIRTGKKLSTKASEIIITFKKKPHDIFSKFTQDTQDNPNRLIIRVQPEEGLKLKLTSKAPGPGGMRFFPSELNLSFGDTFSDRLPDAYERLLMDVVRGNQTLFMRSDEVLAAWDYIDPIVFIAKKQEPQLYRTGTMGPEDKILSLDGHKWIDPKDELK
jgi:glucose-6-phosphate 1-dehydrogenase